MAKHCVKGEDSVSVGSNETYLYTLVTVDKTRKNAVHFRITCRLLKTCQGPSSGSSALGSLVIYLLSFIKNVVTAQPLIRTYTVTEVTGT